MASLAESLEPPITAADIARGIGRLFHRAAAVTLCEVPLGNGRRADVVALDEGGRLTIVEIKVSAADLRGDAKWRDYLAYADRFFWGVPPHLAHLLDADRFDPGAAGVIVADRYDAAVVREAAWVQLNAARRKAETLRFARRAAGRLLWLNDPHCEEIG